LREGRLFVAAPRPSIGCASRLRRSGGLPHPATLVLSCGTRVYSCNFYSRTLGSSQGQPHFFILRAGSLSPPTRSPKQNSAGCWLLATGRGALRSSDRLQIAQIYGTAEICKTGIQQPLTAAYDFRQIPADGARAQNEAEIGDQNCGRLLNLRSHSTQAYEMRPAHMGLRTIQLPSSGRAVLASSLAVHLGSDVSQGSR
jgi:hypothetical protein